MKELKYHTPPPLKIEGFYPECKVYSDGSHYIAIPHTEKPYKPRPKKKEEVITVKPTNDNKPPAEISEAEQESAPPIDDALGCFYVVQSFVTVFFLVEHVNVFVCKRNVPLKLCLVFVDGVALLRDFGKSSYVRITLA